MSGVQYIMMVKKASVTLNSEISYSLKWSLGKELFFSCLSKLLNVLKLF